MMPLTVFLLIPTSCPIWAIASTPINKSQHPNTSRSASDRCPGYRSACSVSSLTGFLVRAARLAFLPVLWRDPRWAFRTNHYSGERIFVLKEFRAFALKGNVVDLAVGIIIGAAFTGIVDSLVDDVLMPPIGLLLGSIDFSNYYLNLTDTAVASLDQAKRGRAGDRLRLVRQRDPQVLHRRVRPLHRRQAGQRLKRLMDDGALPPAQTPPLTQQEVCSARSGIYLPDGRRIERFASAARGFSSFFFAILAGAGPRRHGQSSASTLVKKRKGRAPSARASVHSLAATVSSLRSAPPSSPNRRLRV